MEPNVTFGDYRFDTDSGRLWSGMEELRLTPKASAVLKVLVLRAGQPVTKDDLFASVWNGTAVSDDALTSCIQELRKALADDARQPRFIETRHRRGYRFVAAVSTLPGGAGAPVQAARELPAIAVLPFADMSPERDQDYLCEGLAEELINGLTRIEGLRVASRTASFQFRSPGADVQAVGRHLGVDTLLEGSVRKADNRLRVTVQFIDVANGFHRWSHRFDRNLDDVLAIQDEIAEQVVVLVGRSVLLPHEKPSVVRPHTSAEAYDYYLRGRQYLHRMTKAELERSGDMFECALARDGAYGPAWGCLAAVHATLYEWFGAREDDLAAAERASQKALDLAPSLAEPHAARGFVLSLSGSYQEAAREFEEAIHLNPSFFEAYYYFARSCFANGDIQRAAVLFRQASDTRHEDFQSPILQGLCLRMLGRTDEFRAANKEGIRRAEHVLTHNSADCRALAMGSGALFDDGQVSRAYEWSQRSLELYPDDMITLFNAACLYTKA